MTRVRKGRRAAAEPEEEEEEGGGGGGGAAKKKTEPQLRGDEKINVKNLKNQNVQKKSSRLFAF